MELVYLWVEEYKNIKEQGFNFSPRFKCGFDGKNLTIDENKDYISIFPKNINVAAIVGENGSGKSNLSNILLSKICNMKKFKNIKVFLIFFDGNKLLKYKDNIKLSLMNKTKYNLDDDNYKSYCINFDFSLGDGEIVNDKENHKKKYSIEPSRYYYSPSPGGSSKIEHQSYNALMYSNALYFYKTFAGTNIIDNLDLPQFDKFNFKSKTSIGNDRKKETLESICKIKKIHKPDLQKEYEKIETDLSNISLDIFFDKYQDIQEELLTLFKFSFESNSDNIDFTSLSKGQQYIISYLGIILRLKNKYKNADVINIFYDEVESSFHPSWQRKFLKILLDFIKLSNIFEKKNINLLFVTHSPFILSDIPKENIIFLEKGEQKHPFKENEQTFGANIHTLLSHGFFMKDGLMGEFAKGKIEEIKQFYELVKKWEVRIKENKKPFIYIKIVYLLKINKFRHIQSITGEPFLQTVIKNYLDELEIIFNGKKQFLQDEIKRLQELESSL